MNKRSISIYLLFTAVLMVMLSGCQSSTSGSAEDTAVSEAPSSAGQADEEATSKPEATENVETPETATATPAAKPTMTPIDEPPATAEPIASPLSELGILRTYNIVPEASEVRFQIDEELFGSPKKVVGRTNQVDGRIMLDLQNPLDVEVGTIQVNARDLATDDSFRNRALRSQILDSAQDDYQFITFIPTGIDGLSAEPAEIGEIQTFNLTGDLQIRDIVQSVTFEMMVTANSESELSGSGEAIVLRSDFDLQIPSVPGVANVSNEVELEIEFIAESSEL